MLDVSPEEFERFATPLKIGVVADTHLGTTPRPLPPSLVEELRRVDLILHVGDVCSAAALQLFAEIGPPLRAVVGNNDSAALRNLLPRERRFQFGRFSAGMIHGDGFGRLTARQAAERVFLAEHVDLGIFGHSHRPLVERVAGLLLVNPGSALQRRWQPQHTLSILRIDDAIDAEIRALPY